MNQLNRRAFAERIAKTAGGLFLASAVLPEVLRSKAYATDSSSTLASKATSQAVVGANGKFNGVWPTQDSLNTLVSTLNSYISAASGDGTIDAANQKLKPLAPTVMNNDSEHSTALYNSLHDHGWLGQDSDAVTMMNDCTTSDRTTACNAMQNGITPTLQMASSYLATLAPYMKSELERPGNVVLVSYYRPRLRRVLTQLQCDTFTGGFLYIAAIGAVAALGGVDPLGDLLTAIGAVGAALTYSIC